MADDSADARADALPDRHSVSNICTCTNSLAHASAYAIAARSYRGTHAGSNAPTNDSDAIFGANFMANDADADAVPHDIEADSATHACPDTSTSNKSAYVGTND